MKTQVGEYGSTFLFTLMESVKDVLPRLDLARLGLTFGRLRATAEGLRLSPKPSQI
ncbi:hypothetical protein BS47DRAFT_1403137 [Hydnum rufescens UP504]|uniref:Uncharacterized protein n=1 Tax=Hydnum rufescens UP504 TaxID=1448309 RepID=A0A9P6DLR0_9AGAM|nr:hypothetical protein BS47DRAFT_1403137 [Hydnum rufescens UP504]